MEQVLEIKNIPMSIEFKVNSAHYEINNENASVEITSNDGGSLGIRVKPIKLNIDTVEANYSRGQTINNLSSYEISNYSKKINYQATASYGQEGNMMLNVQIVGNSPEIALQKFNSDVSLNLGNSYFDDADSSWNPQEISIMYEIDKLNFDWKVNRPELTFVPGSIEFVIKEYPRVEINYIGSPIYVPPSSDPDYKPIDTFA